MALNQRHFFSGKEILCYPADVTESKELVIHSLKLDVKEVILSAKIGLPVCKAADQSSLISLDQHHSSRLTGGVIGEVEETDNTSGSKKLFNQIRGMGVST